MELIYQDRDILVCIKPARVLSTDEPGGLPDLCREALGDPEADVRTVHRLDRVVSGLMVLARNAQAASELSRQIRENEFEKEYLAVVHGAPEAQGRLTDLLLRDKRERKTYVVTEPAKGVQEAVLDYMKKASQTENCALLLFDEDLELLGQGVRALSLGKRGDREEHARRLFDLLRAFDKMNIDKIMIVIHSYKNYMNSYNDNYCYKNHQHKI